VLPESVDRSILISPSALPRTLAPRNGHLFVACGQSKRMEPLSWGGPRGPLPTPRRRFVEGCPAEEIDSTGAGDVFAAAFMLRLRESRDPLEAAGFANRVAAYSVTAPGIQALDALAGLPTAS